MTRTATFVALLLVATCSGVAQAAGPERLGGLTFQVPPGLEVMQRKEGAVVLAAPGLDRQEALLIVVFAPEPSRGGLADDLDGAWKALTDGLHAQVELDEGRTHRLQPEVPFPGGDAVLLGEGRFTVQDQRYQARLWLARIGDQSVRVFAWATLLPNAVAYPPTSGLDDPAVGRAIPRLLSSLSIGGRALQGPPPVPASSGIVGLWAGVASSIGKLKTFYVWFSPGGEVFFGTRLPFEGFEGVVPRADAIESPGFWGTYSFDGHQGAIHMRLQERAFPFRLDGGRLLLAPNQNEHAFTRMPATDRSRLAGTWQVRLLDGRAFDLVLSPDGHFEDRGALKILDPHSQRPFRPAARTGRGAWTARSHTVTFRYEDGRLLEVPWSGLLDVDAGAVPAALHLGVQDQVDLVRIR